MQALRGEFVEVRDTDPPAIPPPTTTQPFRFCYPATSADFTATNAYYHYDGAFRVLAGMGFNIRATSTAQHFPCS